MHKKLGMILTLLLCMGMVFSTPVYARSDTETKEEEKTDKEEKGKKQNADTRTLERTKGKAISYIIEN